MSPEPITPECTGKPKDCVLCLMIRNIFEGFPTEQDPGCETGEADASQDRSE